MEFQGPRINPDVEEPEVHRTVAAIWKIESAKIIGALARIVRDVGIAEDLAQDALVVAIERWPLSGIPDNPGAWLMATAKSFLKDGEIWIACLYDDNRYGDIGVDLHKAVDSNSIRRISFMEFLSVFPEAVQPSITYIVSEH